MEALKIAADSMTNEAKLDEVDDLLAANRLDDAATVLKSLPPSEDEELPVRHFTVKEMTTIWLHYAPGGTGWLDEGRLKPLKLEYDGPNLRPLIQKVQRLPYRRFSEFLETFPFVSSPD